MNYCCVRLKLSPHSTAFCPTAHSVTALYEARLVVVGVGAIWFLYDLVVIF